jgi:hypothetical protein
MPELIASPQTDRAERLLKSWSNVVVHNTHQSQTHYMIDRDGRGQAVLPGHRREIAMIDEDIAHFRELRRPGRTHMDDLGVLTVLPLFPVVIEDVAPLPPANAAVAEEARQPIR